MPLVLIVLAIMSGACSAAPLQAGSTPGPSVVASSPLDATPGGRLEDSDVDAALAAAVAAGPSTFRASFSLAAPNAGSVQTLSRSEGTLDLSSSRGSAVYEAYPGLPISNSYEKALVGDQAFVRVGDTGDWEKSDGGARAFLGLDVAGDSALEVVQGALPRGWWVVIESQSGDPPGSIRVTPEDSDATEVVVAIDAAGRLISVTRSGEGGSRPGRVVHELTLLAFGVPFEFEPPG